jgi:outer membrane protein TolC
MGMPPADLHTRLGTSPIPTAPPEAAVGIPADLLRRRPEIRRAERTAAAQSARIGIAESDFYPMISFGGSIGYQASQFSDLFNSASLQGFAAPGFQWNVLNYGRIINNVRLQDARFQELVVAYQNTVLNAAAEVEDGIILFLRAQQRARFLAQSVDAAEKAVKISIVQYRGGIVDFNRVALLEQNLVEQQNLYAESLGEIARGLVDVYRALGGGWQIRLTNGPVPCEGQGPEPLPAGEPLPPNKSEEPPDVVPLPQPVPLELLPGVPPASSSRRDKPQASTAATGPVVRLEAMALLAH